MVNTICPLIVNSICEHESLTMNQKHNTAAWDDGTDLHKEMERHLDLSLKSSSVQLCYRTRSKQTGETETAAAESNKQLANEGESLGWNSSLPQY